MDTNNKITYEHKNKLFAYSLFNVHNDLVSFANVAIYIYIPQDKSKINTI